MERKLIKFFRKNNFNWVHHYSGKVSYEEISKYLKHIPKFDMNEILGLASMRFCHDVFINNEKALLIKIMPVYIRDKKIIFFQLIFESVYREFINKYIKTFEKEFIIVDDNVGSKSSFLLIKIVKRDYHDLSRSLHENSSIDSCYYTETQMKTLQTIAELCNDKFSNDSRYVVLPILWGDKNPEVKVFLEYFPFEKIYNQSA